MRVEPVIIKWGEHQYAAVMRVIGGGDVNLGYFERHHTAYESLTNARALLYLTNTTADIQPIVDEDLT